jgi:hypothetical protein
MLWVAPQSRRQGGTVGLSMVYALRAKLGYCGQAERGSKPWSQHRRHISEVPVLWVGRDTPARHRLRRFEAGVT